MNSTVAMSAAPIGRPGWPDLACSTASMARARMALAMRSCWAREGAGGADVARAGWDGVIASAGLEELVRVYHARVGRSKESWPPGCPAVEGFPFTGQQSQNESGHRL